MIKKIISGGQTGVDRAALDVAIEAGIPHGGWIPKGRKTEEGPLPARYRMREMDTVSYEDRTEQNVLDSHGTLIFSHGDLTGGSALTRELANVHGKPCLHLDLHQVTALDAAGQVVEWVAQNRIEVLNVAGPRASRDRQIYDDVKRVLRVVVTPQEIHRPGDGGTDRSKYELATEVVAGWVREMVQTGYTHKDALETLLMALKSRALRAVHPQIEEYETEIEAVLKNQLGKAH